MNDSKEYLEKKAFFNKVLTIYGRNSVYEALNEPNVVVHRLHLSDSNRSVGIINDIISLAEVKNIEIAHHSKKDLSRISKNAKQDQGVALDIILDGFIDEKQFLNHKEQYRIIALDGVQNPQNLGMIIRSCVAGNIDAIMIQEKNSAKISPLVIKASAGTLFKMTIIKTQNLQNTLINYKQNGAELFSLSPNANSIFNEQKLTNKTIFILGNENEGVSKEIESLANKKIKIPMNNGVESLNVAITAALLSFCN